MAIKGDFSDDVRQLKLLQHTWVQDTKDTNGVVLAAEVEFDGCGVSSKESWV